LQIKIKIVSSHTADYKPVKQEVKSTVILPPFIVPWIDIQMDGGKDKQNDYHVGRLAGGPEERKADEQEGSFTSKSVPTDGQAF
jgi:hypothetical protein